MSLLNLPFLKKMSLIVIGVAFGSMSSLANTDYEIKASDKSAIGSGSSTMELYSPGGVEAAGLFIGHPNQLVRSDRVLLRFDLAPLLLKSDRIQSVSLIFSVDYYISSDDSLDLEIQHFGESVTELNGALLGRADFDSVKMIGVTMTDALHIDGAAEINRSALPREVDVTEVVKNDLSSGHTASTFRMRLPSIEASGNDNLSPVGLRIANGDNVTPTLSIKFKD